MTCILNIAASHLNRITLATALIASAFTAAEGQASVPIVVEVVSGRQFHAELHERTDSERLWLAFRTQSAELLRPIAWDRVITAEMNGETFAGAELREHILTRPVSVISQDADQDQAQPTDTTEELPEPEGDGGRTMADEAVELLFSKPVAPAVRVASVQFDAHLANWDSDVEADGLIVHVIPVNAAGQIVAARGHVSVELYATRRIAFQDGPHKRGRRIDRIGRWTQRLNSHYFDQGGYWFKLPFQASHPEFDTDLGASGLVNVRLVVPGDGVFESSIDGVRVRPFAPLRDDMQQVEGRRFLANERTGRGVRAD